MIKESKIPPLRYIFITIVFLMSLSISASPAERGRGYNVKGRVVSSSDNQPASFAVVSIDESGIRTICDIDGRFVLTKVPEGKHMLHVTCLGYTPCEKQLNINADANVTIKLLLSSISLPEMEVMASKPKDNKIVVNEAALQYIQPISLADVLLLLPGNVYKENSMGKFQQISSRQVGTDSNSSLGVSVVTDGAPVTDDGMRSQLVGVTQNSMVYGRDTEIQSRKGLNQGTDLRYISTDHIQSVEFVRGISDARYGNMSSGMIHVNSKYGTTPLRLRLKADLKNKLLYAGKGFRLSEKAGTLHFGADLLSSVDDIREKMNQFTRVTAQTYYNNQFVLGGCKLNLDMKLNQTFTVNQTKRDEMTYLYNEDYKADYSRTALMLKSVLNVDKNWLDKLELMISSDLVFDRISRHKMVISSSGPLNVPLAKEEGEHEGIYLPGKYYSDFYIDNVPLNVFAQLHANSRVNISKPVGLNVQYGLEYRNSKNYGDGAVIADETLPPFPYDNTYMRPRRNKDIPGMSIGAAYMQAEVRYAADSGSLLKLSLGGRATQMFNLDNSYLLSGRVLVEPRTNVSFAFGNAVRHTIHAGYGEENKLPTLDYLYPERLYKDFYMLNAYTVKPEYRRLITYTNIFDVANKQLRENKNRKAEIGWNVSYKGFNFSITAFYEKSVSGFEYFTRYHPLSYNLYTTLNPGADITDRKPEKTDYVEEQYSLFTTASQVMNSKKVVKRGIEYRIILPKIELLSTSIELNGAYYHTNYGSSLPEYYYPSTKVGNKLYPYVGIYDNDPQNEYRRLNTNLWFNTHIPKYKLIFTNFVQLVWLSSSQYKDNRRKIPYEYVDMQGQTHSIGAEQEALILSEDFIFRQLKRTILPINYACDSKPVSLLWNIKATKEFNKYTSLSFFVNGILDINPKYLSGGRTTERTWTEPYFGVELFFNLDL